MMIIKGHDITTDLGKHMAIKMASNKSIQAEDVKDWMHKPQLGDRAEYIKTKLWKKVYGQHVDEREIIISI